MGTAFALLAICAPARAATWTDDASAVQRVLTLASGEAYSLTEQDVSDLVSSAKDFVVRGSGTVTGAVDMASFAKNAVIESGCSFVMEAANCFGTASGSVTVQDGASLRLNKVMTGNDRMLKNKKVYFAGEGPDGNGAIWAVKSDWRNTENCEFYLAGDAKARHDARLNYSTFLDTCGHDLEILGWSVCGGTYVTNSAATASTIKKANGSLLIGEWSSANPFRGSADNVFVLSNVQYSTASWNVPNGWTLAFEGNAYVNATKWVADGATASLDFCNFSGPIQIRDTARFTIRTNAAMTVSGPLSGTGTVTVDGGWLNLASTNVTYTGAIAVQAKAVHEPIWRAGLALRTSTALPLSGLSFADADLLLADDFTASLPPLTFTGANATNRVTGGQALLPRLPCPTLTVAAGATAVVASPLAVADAAVGANGALRVVNETSLVGYPGLMGYEDTSMTTPRWFYAKPTEEEIAANYTNRYVNGFTPNDALADKTRCRNVRYHGYIWNRTDANATWSFLVNFNGRVWIWLDGTQLYTHYDKYKNGVSNYMDATNRVTTVSDVTPGAHEIIVIVESQQNEIGPTKLGDTYCTMGFDSQGRGMTSDFATYYVPLADPGDGSLLTVDTSETVDSALCLPNFTNLTFAAGATFDGGGGAQTVETLTGCPAVTGVPTLTINETFTVKVADFLAGGSVPCTTDGAVAFGADAVIELELPETLTSAQKAVLKGGVTILSAASISGDPQLTEAAKSANYRLTRQGGSLILTREKGSLLIIR